MLNQAISLSAYRTIYQMMFYEIHNDKITPIPIGSVIVKSEPKIVDIYMKQTEIFVIRKCIKLNFI